MANLRTNNLFGESGQDSNGSALFDASNHLTAANVAAFRVNQGSSEDFTIEAWIYLRATPDGANARIASIYHTSGNQRSYMLYVHTDDTLKFNYASNGTAGSVSTLAAGKVPHNQWVHVAVTHDSSATTVRLFNNGVLRATDTGAHATYHANTSGDFIIGEDFNGNISNLHITRGTCKYTGDFIPSKEPIEEDSNTTVLCCNSRFNPLSDDKSNTFTQTSDGAVEASSFIPFDRADSGNVFNGPIKHNTQGYMYFPTGRTEERGRGRGLFNGGGGPINTIQYIQIQSSGNSLDFGDLTTTRDLMGSAASSVRGLFGGQGSPTYSNTIDFVTIATTSNAIDFGDLLNPNYTPGALASNTRAVWGGGATPADATEDTIQFATIASLGNTTDFGNLTVGRRHVGGLSSPTRGVYGAGAAPGVTNVMDFITIASTGDATDFGDMTETKNDTAGCSSAIRGLFIGGDSGTLNTIEFITIATTGNGTDFGDLPAAIRYGAGLTDSIRGVFTGGGAPGGTSRNSIDFVIIETTGNAQDFGDLITALHYPSACSDSHGGLS